MQHRESFVEMNVDANDYTNATIDIGDVDRVSGGDAYHRIVCKNYVGGEVTHVNDVDRNSGS